MNAPTIFVMVPKVADDYNVQQWLDREFFAATAKSEGCDAKWYAGDRIDWQMAVSALFPYSIHE